MVEGEKLALIKSMNPTWQDLAEGWGEPIGPLEPRMASSVGNDDTERESKDEGASLTKKQSE